MSVWRHCFVVMLALASCEGKTDSDSTPPVDPIALQQHACAEYARVWCDGDKTCRPARFAGSYADMDTCIQREAELCEKTRFGEGSLLGADELLTCAAASDVSALAGDLSARCEKWFGWELGRTPPVECRTKGRLPDGEPCLDANQCERGTCRGSDPRTQTCGTCGAMSKLNESCTLDAECEAPYVCAPVELTPGEITGKCTQVGGPDSDCAADAPCRPYLRCVDGKCKPLGVAGAACSPESGTSCAPWLSLACAEEGTCGAITPDRPENARCGGTDVCAPGLVCKEGATVGATACVPAIADDKVCALIQSYLTGPCQAPAICAGGAFATSARCKIPDAAACNLVLPP